MIHVCRHVSPEGPTIVGGVDALDLPIEDGELRWVDLEAPTEEEVRRVGKVFGLHPLALDDCLSDDHHPKLDDYGDHVFLIARGVDPTPGTEGFLTTKVAAFLSEKWLVTYHRVPMAATTEVRNRLAEGGVRIFELGCDQVLHAVLDRVVDAYFPALEELGDELGLIEDRIFEGDEQRILERLLAIRRDLLHLRRHAAPQRELVSKLARGDVRFIDPASAPYFRDIYDHTFRIAEVIDNLRELAAGILEIQLSKAANRTNEIMRVLTVITTVFIPLNFLVGLYGMNFEHMPELKIWWAYPAVLCLMVLLAGLMVLAFKRRRWL